jgi:hypothetical protein
LGLLPRNGSSPIVACDFPPAADELDTIRTDLQSQHALGSTRFQMAIERQLARRVGPAKAPPAAKW